MGYGMKIGYKLFLLTGCMILLNSCSYIDDYYDKHLYPKFDEVYPNLSKKFPEQTSRIKCDFNDQRPEYVENMGGYYQYVGEGLDYPNIEITNFNKNYLLVFKRQLDNPSLPYKIYGDMASSVFGKRKDIKGYVIRGVSRCFYHNYLIDSKNFPDTRFDGIFLMTNSGTSA